MAQKPISKVNIKTKESKYKKVLKNPKTDSDALAKKINKNAIKRHEDRYKALVSQKQKKDKK